MSAMRVYKYEIPMPDAKGCSVVNMPKGSVILSVGLQGDSMVLWARVTGSVMDARYRKLLVVNTGPLIEHDGRPFFIGTLTTTNGIVWHIFEERPDVQ